MPQLSPIALLLLILFLPKAIAQYLVPLALVAILYQGRKDVGRFLAQKFVIFGALIGPFMVAVMTAPVESLRFFSLIILIMIFPFSTVKVNGVASIALMCFFYALIFQVGIMWGLPFFAEFRSEFYPAELVTWVQGDLSSIDVGFRSIRASGLFYNPNVAALMSLFVYVIYALSIRPQFSGRFHFLVLVLAAASLAMAGSRTYIAAFALIVFFNFFKGGVIKFAVAAFFLMISMGFLYTYIFQDFTSESGSMFLKNEILLNYISSRVANDYGFISLIFGGEYQIQFDNDIGYILGGWGLLGLFSVTTFTLLFMIKFPNSWRVLLFMLVTMIGNSLFYGLLTAPLMVCLLIVLSKACMANADAVKGEAC